MIKHEQFVQVIATLLQTELNPRRSYVKYDIIKRLSRDIARIGALVDYGLMPNQQIEYEAGQKVRILPFPTGCDYALETLGDMPFHRMWTDKEGVVKNPKWVSNRLDPESSTTHSVLVTLDGGASCSFMPSEIELVDAKGGRKFDLT